MEQIELQIQVTLDSDSIEILARGIAESLHRLEEKNNSQRTKMTAQEASKNALFRGESLPTGKGLLVDTKEVAELLGVSTRTIYRMQQDGSMPEPMRIGRAIRWSLDVLKKWVNEGCPANDERVQ